MVKLPILDNAHHGSSHAHIDGLSNLREEFLLDLKSPLPDAPATIHQEDQVHCTLCRTCHSKDVSEEEANKLYIVFPSNFSLLFRRKINTFLLTQHLALFLMSASYRNIECLFLPGSPCDTGSGTRGTGFCSLTL